MTDPEDGWDKAAEAVERERVREHLTKALSDGVITEKTHARCMALLDGEPDPYPDPEPEPAPDLEELCALSVVQTMRIAVRVMEMIHELGAPRATPIDVARIMGITVGIGRAVAPEEQRAAFDAAFNAGGTVAQSWAAGHRAAAAEAADS